MTKVQLKYSFQNEEEIEAKPKINNNCKTGL